MNGLAAGAELAGQGTFVSPGIFVLALNPPITNLPPSHVTATVLDAQGNRATTKVRFWVAPLDFRILKVDSGERASIRFENPDSLTGHTVLWTDQLPSAPANWSSLPVINWANESNRVRRVEVQPPLAPAGFFRIRQP